MEGLKEFGEERVFVGGRARLQDESWWGLGEIRGEGGEVGKECVGFKGMEGQDVGRAVGREGWGSRLSPMLFYNLSRVL